MNDTTTFGEAPQAVLKREAGFTAANKTFHRHVCTFLADRGFRTIEWGVWLDVRGMALSGNTTSAARLLRDASKVSEKVLADLPQCFEGEHGAFVEYTRRNCNMQIIVRTPPLIDVKRTIDLLRFNEDAFGE